MDFHTMKRKELQALCREHGIPANLKNAEMADKLTLLLKEKAKPLTRCQSCVKNLDEIASDNDFKDGTRKLKKVRFSPEHEMVEFVDLKEDLDNEIPLPVKRVTRRRSAMNPVGRKSGIVIENDENTKLPEGIMDNPVRVTRSYAQKLMNGDIAMVLSPPVEKKKARRGKKSGNVEVKEIDGSDNPPPVVELADNIDFREAYVKEIRRSGDTILAGEGGSSKPGKVLRRSKRNATKMKDSGLLDGELGQIEIVRRITQSGNRLEGQEASAVEIGKETEFEDLGEREVVLQLEEPSRGSGRKASKRKSVAPKKENVRSDRPLVENETGKQLRNTLSEEGRSESVELLKENKMVSLANGPLRRSRRNTIIVKSTAPTNGELGTHENVGRIEQLKQLREPLPVKEASVSDENLRRSRRNASRPDSITTSNGMDGIVNAIGKNELWKWIMDPIQEDETAVPVIECEPLIEDPLRLFTRNASKRKSIALAGLTGKVVRKMQPENRLTVPILELEAPLSNSKSSLDESPIVDAENEPWNQRMAPIWEDETSVTECEPLIKDPPRRFTPNASKRKSIALVGLTGKVVGKQLPENRSTVPILELEAPLSNSKSALEESPIVDAGVTVIEAAKSLNDPVLSHSEEGAKDSKKSRSKRTTPLTPIIDPEYQGSGNGDKVISSCGHTLVIDNNEQEQEGTQANAQYLVQPTMLGRSNTNNVEGEESSSYETIIPNGAMCRDETFVSKAGDGMSSQGRTEEAVTAKENEPEEASYMGRSKPAAGGETTYVGTKVNLDVEFVRKDSEGQVSMARYSGGSEKNSDNVYEKVMEKSMLEFSNGEGITSIFADRDADRVGNPLISITAPETFGIVDEDKTSCENITLEVNDKHELEEDQLDVHFSIPIKTSIPIKNEETSCHEAEMVDGTMSEGEEVLASNMATGRFSQEKSEEVVGAKEGEHEEKVEIGITTLIRKEITDEGSQGNLDAESMGVDGSIYPVLDESFSQDGLVAEDKESGGSKANCESASEEGRRTCILKFSVGAEISPVISEEREHDKAENLDEVSGIHEIVAESHEVPADTAAVMVSSIQEALASNMATGRFSQEKSVEVEGAKEGEHEGTVEIGSASPIISKEITDEGSNGNLDAESMGVDGSICPVLDESFSQDRLVAEDKESGGSKANCGSASEDGRTQILKFSVEAETSPVISEDRKNDKAENGEEVSGIHEIVAESHEVLTDTAVVKDTEIEHGIISQISVVTASLTPIHAPECQGYRIGYKNILSRKHSLSIEDDMQGQEGNQLKVLAGDTNPLEREEALLHEIENWVLDNSSYWGAGVAEKNTKTTSANKYSECELGKKAVNEVMEAGSLPQSALKEFLDGKHSESENLKDIFDEVLSQHTFGDCSAKAERRGKVKVTFDSNGAEGLPKDLLLALISPELVSKKLYDHEEEAVERNYIFDAVKDVPSSKSNVVTEDKVNYEGMKEECKVEHFDHVIKERNAELCSEFELGDYNDCHKVVAQVNGSAELSLVETICEENEVFEEKNVEMMKSNSECITIIDKLKEEENGETSLPVCPLELGQVVSDYGDGFSKMNVNVPGVSGKTVLCEASEETSTEVAKVAFECKDAKDVLMDIENGTIPQVEELMSFDFDDHNEEVLQEMEHSYFICSDELTHEDGEAAGRNEKVGTMEGKFDFDDKNSGAVAIDVDTWLQVTENDFGNQLEEEKVAQMHDSDWDDHIHDYSRVLADKAPISTIKRMDILKEVEKGGTLLPAGPVGLSQFVLDYGLEFAQMNVGAPGASDKTVCADGEDSETILDETAKTGLQPDEVNFGSHYDHKEEVVSEQEKSSFTASDPENGEAAEGEENVKTMVSMMSFMDDNSDAEWGEDVYASPQVTGEDFGDHLVAEEVVDVNDNDHDVILDHICDNTRVAVDNIAVSMDGKGASENIKDGTLVSPQRFNSSSKLDLRNTADMSCLKPEMGSSNATVSLLNVSLSHGEEYESHIYDKDANNDSEEKEMNDRGRGNTPKVMDMPYEDNEVTMEKSTGAEKGNNDANNDSYVEENTRTFQEVAGEQLGDHVGAVHEADFVAGSDCLTANKPSCVNRRKSIVKETEEAHGSSRKFDDMVICVDQSKEFADFKNFCDVSPMKPEMGGSCSAVSLVSAPAEQENGTTEFKVESCMFSSLEINLYLADGEEDEVKESNVDYVGVSVCESNEDAGELKENEIVMQLVGEEQLGKDKHHMEEEFAELNGAHVAFSDEPISEDGVVSREKNDVAITTKECKDSEYTMKESVEVENSLVSTHVDILTEFATTDGSGHAASVETMAEGDPMDLIAENVATVVMTDEEKCEDIGEAKELTEAILKSGSRMVDQSLAFIDSAVGRGVAAEDTEMQQSELEFTRNKNIDAKIEYSNGLYAKQLNSSMTKRKNVGTPLIPTTPKKLLNMIDMKENAPSIRGELTGNITAVKSVTKRRALEDLQKN